jgi:hypothetical protein
MLRLLLDEHIPTAVGPQVRAHDPAISIQSLQEWERGIYLRTSDETIMSAAHEQRLTLLTYDQKTINPMLKHWGERGRDHSGVIFVDRSTLSQDDVGGLVRGILRIWSTFGSDDWLNRVTYLGGRQR